ncbi:MAG: DUF983 domain-containing protein [Anaerolineae bacterium]
MNIRSILQGKCPRCHKAHVFKTFWQIHEDCSHCGIRFERESGYFSMSIFVGYILAGIVAAPGIVASFFLGLSFFWTVVIPSVCVVLASPWIFHYSRIIWLHADERMDPRRD